MPKISIKKMKIYKKNLYKKYEKEKIAKFTVKNIKGQQNEVAKK